MIWCKGFTDIRRCKLCQDVSDKGIKFRKQFGLDTIPACPFKGKSAPKPVPFVRTQEAAKVVEKDHYDMLPRVMSTKLWQETVESFDKNDQRYSEVYGLSIWLTGVGKIPGRESVCEKRSKLMWDLRNYALNQKWCRRKIILVGNSSDNLTADLGEYDAIGIFNNPRKKEFISFATHHFMRSDKHDLSHHGGEEYIPKLDDEVQIVLCDGGKHAKDLRQKNPRKKFYLTNCRQWATTYPKTKAPSTGHGMLMMYNKWGWHVTLACFSWEGLKVHDWQYEKNTAFDLQARGELQITDCSISQLSSVPLQISSETFNVKKPCGCKKKQGA